MYIHIFLSIASFLIHSYSLSTINKSSNANRTRKHFNNLLPSPQSVGGGLLQLFGDFCPSVCPSVRRNPPMLNSKGRLRESTHSRYNKVMLSPAQWCGSVKLLPVCVYMALTSAT